MYRIDKKIGSGGYATAYKAFCLKTKTVCVVKKMDFKGFNEYERKSCIGEA